MRPNRPATIVVVERCPAAQELIEQALRDPGHRVLVTADPSEVLRLAEGMVIDLIVWTLEEDASLAAPQLTSVQADVRQLTLDRPFSLPQLEWAVADVLADLP